MSDTMTAVSHTEVHHRHTSDGMVDDDVNKDWDVIHGNTMKLAALFGDVSVGVKRHSRVENTHPVIKVVSVTRQRRDSSSDSSSDEGQKRQITKVTTVTSSVKVHRRENESSSDSSDTDDEVRKQKKTITVVKQQSKEVGGGKYSATIVKKVEARDSSEERKKVTVVKKVEAKDSNLEKKVTVVKKGTKEVSIVKKDSSSSSDDSGDDKKVERKQVAAAVKVIKRAEEGRKEEKIKEKHKEKTTAVVKKKVITSKDNSSSDDSDDENKVEKKQVAAAVKVINRVEEGRKEEKIKEKHKEKAKTVVKKVRESSSDSEDDRRKKIIVSKEVKVTKRGEVERQRSESDSEAASKKQVTKVVKVQKKEVRDDSSDSEQAVEKVVKEKVKKEVVEKRHAKSKQRDRSSSSSSSSSDDETEQRKETKTIKVTKVVKVNDSSSSDDEERTKVKKVEVKKARDELEIRRRKVLVVTAHVSKDSYEGALYKAAIKLLKGRGDKVQTSNLYEMGFNPVASPQDFGGYIKEKGVYNYSLLAGQAKAEGRLAQDIVAEQEKVQWAELILIVSPIQNHGLPALLKGWFDRIMIYNFAYSEGRFYENGLLRDKKVLLCLTSPAMSSMYTSYGIHGDLNVYLWPIVNGILRFAGLDVLRPQVYFGVGRVSDDYKEKVIEAFQERLQNVWSEKPLSFIPMDKFREKRGFALSGRSMAELAETGQLTVAHYAGSHAVSMTMTVEPETKLRGGSKATSGVEVGNPWRV